MKEKPLSYLIDSLVPDYIKSDYPTYISFVQKYLEMQEEESGPFTVLNNITKYIDVTEVPEDTLDQFVYQYLYSFPEEYLQNVNVREFVTNSKNFYSRKGVETSVRFIFNLIQGSIDFYYPSTEIFECNISLLSGPESGTSITATTDKLHDNVYYAYYVYEIISDLDFDIYEDIIREMVHPIGMKMYFKKVVFIGEDGIIFDAQIDYKNQIIYTDHTGIISLSSYDNTEIITGQLISNSVANFSDIIGDHFAGEPTSVGPTLFDYFGYSIQTLTQDKVQPVEITQTT